MHKRSDRPLEMDRKKCKSTGGQATHSRTRNTTVPWNDDAVEVGEMVTTEHVGTSVVDSDEDGEQLDYLEVASLLQEKLNDFVEGGKGGPPGLELRSLLDLAIARKIVFVHPKKMSPALWRTLPKELLLNVFARLPVPDIARLRSLSKEWNQAMATVNSEFNRALDEASPTMFASLSRLPKKFIHHSEFLVTIHTQRSECSYRLHLEDPNVLEDGWDVMEAIDGGLVCFVSTWKPSKAKPLVIVVVNLLTRVRRKLPPLQYVYLTPPITVHIEVDSGTKCYRVVVVGKNIKGRPSVEIYHSGARRWTKTAPPLGSIFGLAHTWKYNTYYRNFEDNHPVRSVYDFAERQLKKCREGIPEGAILLPYDPDQDYKILLEQDPSVITFSHLQDCKFVLHRNTSNGEMVPTEGYCIIKSRSQNDAKDWVQERSYSCHTPYEALLDKERCTWFLTAYAGFLRVITLFPSDRKQFWLLDLSTGEWSNLPSCFEDHRFGFQMIRAFWNVVP